MSDQPLVRRDGVMTMRKGLKVGGASVVVLAVVLGVGLWFELRSDAKPKAAMVRSAVAVRSPLDGTWAVVADPTGPDATSSWVGYRISETLAGLQKTDVGRSRSIAGALKIHGSTLSKISMTADASKLTTDVALRDTSVRTVLDTTHYPKATFVSNAPVKLPSVPKAGELVRENVPGTLTVHGVSRQVVAPLRARWNGHSIEDIGEVPIVMADYQIAIPVPPLSPVHLERRQQA